VPFLIHSKNRDRVEWSAVSDRELLRAIQAGEEEAFDQLIKRKTGPLMQLAYRIVGDRAEAQDIVQVTFVRVWENRHTFEERWSPNTWLYRIATNLAIDHLRSRRGRERSTEPVRHHLRQVAASRHRRQLSELHSREVAVIFERLASCLTEKQRLIFLLRGAEGLSSQEVADIVGCRPSTVRNHLFAARKKLRGELLRLYPEYSLSSVADDEAEGER
jgi:RNA polymerase sigma-70 factor (ECF subfamily)